MNNYLLTVFGEFETKEMCQNVALSITPIVDSPNLKFQHFKGVLLFYFSSEIPKEEIYEYVRGVLYGITESFILTTMTDDVLVSIPEDIYNHLFDLENSNGELDMKLDMNRIKNNLDFMEEEEDDEKEFSLSWTSKILNNMKKQVPKPSLDQILDKVLTNGMESLSPFEKDTLETYSK
jgi:hypothetical protein